MILVWQENIRIIPVLTEKRLSLAQRNWLNSVAKDGKHRTWGFIPRD